MNLNFATKLTRTYALHMEALDKHRGKGQQKVTVEHVHVHQGGQAIVGTVNHPGPGGVQKSRGTTPCRSIAHAPEPEMRSALPEDREAVPERAMPNGRCRMHGGKATGAPKGNKNAWKHGGHSASERARRALMKYLLSGAD